MSVHGRTRHAGISCHRSYPSLEVTVVPKLKRTAFAATMAGPESLQDSFLGFELLDECS
jgi:hypothetical protein